MEPFSGVLMDPRPIFVRGAYNYDTDYVSRETGLKCEDESLALQSHAEDADINTIVKRFGLTGQLPEGVRAPTYGDFTEVVDFRTAQDALVAAREAFMAMPADVRSRFSNDPALFVDFCSDEKNLEEMRKMGLAVEKPAVVESVQKVEIVSTVAKGDSDGKQSGANVGAASGAAGSGSG